MAGARSKFLTVAVRKSISDARTATRLNAAGRLPTTGEGASAKQKAAETPEGTGDETEHQGTLCRDGDGRSRRPQPGGPSRPAGRNRRPAGDFAVLSGAAVRQAAPRRTGEKRA